MARRRRWPLRDGTHLVAGGPPVAGLTGCRRTLPAPTPMLDYLDAEHESMR
ncbi:hypothetical protein RAJCM14343_1725 [Rhodococcus aetherivorans]|uniref:Uncharacterized protein n=1 Tax=Rhodococcus aetherivorans TaxID=191292 RepID=A0ABQ0YJ09_9NOCA|nr:MULTISPECIES: hypothetical protein [Rhodococcus]MDV6296970.1 hypothetical protein [Rhodococcus aetherivorans]NGP29681.1 hypothetical protein [Rhodococcus aetherivorans]WFS12177.1 hypothetical protein P9K37_20660 [Rhodococcus aetherivorans]WKW99158.1 hypothetical protein Q3O43_02220 [Rhodococcus aetherivorans]GES36473.1 hypothetical protein RAJCM14343_1725 [Rhodococcus aetherivorans]